MSRRRVIALMMGNPGLSADYQGVLRAGVEQRCTEEGVDLWVYAGRTDWHSYGPQQGLIYELVAEDRVDGIILAGGVIACFLDLPRAHASLRERCPVPMCSAGYRLDGVPSITIDNGPGMALAVEHLAGHHRSRHFGVIAGPRGHEESEERLRAARDVLNRHGIALPAQAVVYGNFSHEAGVEGMLQLARQLTTLDAVVVANDDMAAGALKALAELGRRCPEQIALVGFDDALSSRISSPAITTVRQPVFQLGAQAADVIMAQWRGEVCPPLSTLATEAVIRESCGCDPVTGPMSFAVANPTPPEDRVITLLGGVVGGKEASARWGAELWSALDAECSGRPGALREVLQRLLDGASNPDVQLFDLQRVITCLRATRSTGPAGTDLNDVYHHALIQIGHAVHRRDMLRQAQDKVVMEELRVNWRRLGTSLSFESLREVLVRDLPRFSVRNAMVSVYPGGDYEHLIPLACLADGLPVALDPVPFPASKLRPDRVPVTPHRCSLAILPLTFEREPLGIAMLDLPAREAYHMLRDQIASAIKTVHLHETLMQQQERLKVQAQAENQAIAERLKSMSLIAGGVAHDLNNALGPLLALPAVIREDLNRDTQFSPQAFLADLDTLSEAAQHASHTIRDLLALGRTVDVPLKTVDVNQILSSERRSLKYLAERTAGVELKLVAADEPLLVRVSREHLLRAVSNLVANASDAMTGPGEIAVRVLERAVVERLEGIEPVEPGRYAVIEVEDTGCGIPSDNLPHVLEPFFSSKPQTARGGTGLGLAIVHQVVRQCGGYVRVRSEVGVGTTFALYIPLLAQGLAVESAPPAPAVGGHERILVVDDEQVQLRTAQRILGQLGYRVSTVTSGAAAIALFEQHLDDEPFDLVILDVMMPGALNGLQTLERLRQQNPQQRALLASGYAPEQLARDAAQQATNWLAKPYTVAALARAVRSALEVLPTPESPAPAPRPSLPSPAEPGGTPGGEPPAKPRDTRFSSPLAEPELPGGGSLRDSGAGTLPPPGRRHSDRPDVAGTAPAETPSPRPEHPPGIGVRTAGSAPRLGRRLLARRRPRPS